MIHWFAYSWNLKKKKRPEIWLRRFVSVMLQLMEHFVAHHQTPWDVEAAWN